jgi:hypothetical protein
MVLVRFGESLTEVSYSLQKRVCSALLSAVAVESCPVIGSARPSEAEPRFKRVQRLDQFANVLQLVSRCCPFANLWWLDVGTERRQGMINIGAPLAGLCSLCAELADDDDNVKYSS